MDVEMHDGSHLRIRKLDRDYDPTNRLVAGAILEEAEAKGEVLTGVLYVNPNKPTFVEQLNMSDAPLATLPEAKTRPSRDGPGAGHGGTALGAYREDTRKLQHSLRCICARQMLASCWSVILRDRLL